MTTTAELDKYGAGRVELTDTEWMSMIVKDRGGLEPCCGDISDLRDYVTSLARDPGEVWPVEADLFLGQVDHVAETHDLTGSPTLVKLADQVRAIKAAQDARPEPARKPQPPQEERRLPADQHVHLIESGKPTPEPCEQGLLCKQYPREIDVIERDGKVRSYSRIATRADGIAHGMIAARQALTLVLSLPQWQVPLYDMLDRAHDELVNSTRLAVPVLWPDQS